MAASDIDKVRNIITKIYARDNTSVASNGGGDQRQQLDWRRFEGSAHNLHQQSAKKTTPNQLTFDLASMLNSSRNATPF